MIGGLRIWSRSSITGLSLLLGGLALGRMSHSTQAKRLRSDKALIAQIKSRKTVGLLQIKDSVGKKDVGGGLKTGSRRPKRRGRPPKSKEEVKPKRKSKAKPKKPKGLKKSKRAN